MNKFADLWKAVHAKPDAFGQWAACLTASAKHGPGTLSVMHYLLLKSDPRYVALIKDIFGTVVGM